MQQICGEKAAFVALESALRDTSPLDPDNFAGSRRICSMACDTLVFYLATSLGASYLKPHRKVASYKEL